MARDKTVEKIRIDDVEKRRQPTKHYVYVITVTWSDGNVNVIYRRYSKFFDFQVKLLDSFPKEAGKYDPAERIIPFLPGKIIFGRSHIRDVAVRRLELINTYCQQLIRLPKHISTDRKVTKFFESTIEDLISPKSRTPTGVATMEVREISEPVLLEQYTVLANYKKEGNNEISLHNGELVEVIEKNDSGWWFVSGEDGQGWVPSTFLALPGEEDNDQDDDGNTPGEATDISENDRPHLAVEQYIPEFPDEIMLERGMAVEVIQKNLNGWWRVRCRGKEGLVPGNFLTRAGTTRAKKITDALKEVDKKLAKTNLSPTPEEPTPDTPPALPSKSSAQKPQPVQRKNVPQPNPQAPNTKARRNSPPDTDEDSPPTARKPPPPRKKSVRKMAVLPPEAKQELVYMTIADFENSAGDGISFNKGAVVEVIDKHADGHWWYVNIGGNIGWAPAQYIKKRHKPKSPEANNTKDKTPAAAPAPVSSGGKSKAAKPTPAEPLDKGAAGAKSRRPPPPVPGDDDDDDRESYENIPKEAAPPPALPTRNRRVDNNNAPPPAPARTNGRSSPHHNNNNNRSSPATRQRRPDNDRDHASDSSSQQQPQQQPNIVATLAAQIRSRQAQGDRTRVDQATKNILRH